MERLQKFLAEAGVASRRAAEELIVSGRVERLDGAVSLLAGRLRRIRAVAAVPSRDFR